MFTTDPSLITLMVRCSSQFFSFVVAISIFTINQCQSTVYYLNQANGNDSTSGTDINNAFQTADTAANALSPGDTLIIVGELSNPSYDPNYSFNGDLNDSQIWHQENTFKLNNLEGTSNAWITITSNHDSTVLRGDGANILRIDNCAYIRLQNLTLIGEVLNIPYSTAKALQFVYEDNNGIIQYRVNPNLSDDEISNLTLVNIGTNIIRPSYTDTRGIYVSDSHHILIENNLVSNTPGNGLRVAKSEYVDIIANEVVNTSRKSYSGTHGLVVTYTTDKMPQENEENYRCRILRNIVHHNYNEIYSWAGWKTFIHTYIDEGKGISLERNQNFNNSGRILMANNIAYWNGYAGINNHDGNNVDMISNTAYMNSYTNTITYANRTDKSGNNVGISINSGENCTIINNIAVIDASDPLWIGKALSVAGITGTLKVSSNIIYGIGNQTMQYDEDLNGIQENIIESDPKFVQYLTYTDAMTDYGDAFEIMDHSPAISNAYPGFVPCEDYFANNRMNDTIGAVTIDSNSYNLNNNNSKSHLEACYSWIPNATLDEPYNNDNTISSYIFEIKAIEDGFIRYWQDDFKGTLDYLDVKHPTGSDLKETHLKFEFIESDFKQFINDSINDTNASISSDNCEIARILLKMKSTGDDKDLTDNLLVYLAFGNWSELQNNTIGVPSTNDSIGILASPVINVTANTWVNIELNQSIVCTELLDCINFFHNNYVHSWEFIISATYDARVLQFYSKESNANNTATFSIQIDCNNSIIANVDINSSITTTEATTTSEIESSFFFTTEIETTESVFDNTVLEYNFDIVNVKDGFIRYRENDFNGELSYLDIKNRPGSDLRETHLCFNVNLLDLANTINESITDSNYKCQITKTRLKMKSMGWDKDVAHDLLIYLTFGNWSESQTDTIGVPSTNDSIVILASIPIYLIKDKWVTVTLNQSLLCNELFECNDIFNNNTLTYEYNWNMIVSTTEGARVLQFYSKESSISNAAQINLQIECNNTKLLTQEPTGQPSISPTIHDKSASNPMLTPICYLSLFGVFFLGYL